MKTTTFDVEQHLKMEESGPVDLSESSERPHNQEEDGGLATNETKLVNRSKLLVYGVLILAAAAVSSVTYLFLAKEEEDNMKAEFAAYSREILKQAQANADKMFEDMMDLSKDLTSHALDNNLKWPNITLPHFDVRARESTVRFVAFAPFVTPETREGWEAYSVEHQDWIQQDYSYRNWTQTPPRIPPTIHRFNESSPVVEYDDLEYQYEVPLWQVSPPRPDYSAVNMDLSTIPILGHLFRDVKVKKVEQYGRIMDFKGLYSELLAVDVDDHPRGSIFQPVFEDFRADAEVVGFMMGSLEWDGMFRNVIFGGAAPLIVEIEGTCNSLFTYRVIGERAIFLGYGQGLRDSKYDKYKESADLLDPKESRDGYPPVVHTHRSTDASHPESHCTYVMNTYPTAEFEASFQTKDPIIYTLVILAVFLFTALVFGTYDYLVNRRQLNLMHTAKSTSALVASLFPKDVQKRILDEAREQAEREHAQKNKRNTKKVDLNGFFDEEQRSAGTNRSGKPIADLFPHCTVMVCSINSAASHLDIKTTHICAITTVCGHRRFHRLVEYARAHSVSANKS
eukprot:scaffold792_cov163-Amphora_coffeaeformis.AAC.3